MKENEYVTFCKCGCGDGVVLKFDTKDDELSLQFVSDNFYVMQKKGKMSFREKIKRIWYIITGNIHPFKIIPAHFSKTLPHFEKTFSRNPLNYLLFSDISLNFVSYKYKIT